MVAILQPHIPHYREDFFARLNNEVGCSLFCYEVPEESKRAKFHAASNGTNRILAAEFKNFLLYNPFPLLKPQYRTIVLMLHFGHITTWLLLLTKFLHRKEVILWGHGISVKRYLKESKDPPRLLKWMIRLSDVVWLYTPKEQALWASVFPDKKIVSLNNTISGLENIKERPISEKSALKAKYGIRQKRVLIFCARFNTPYRRADLLEEVVKSLDPEEYGFIIIGDGELKPDFSKYTHVYDYGNLYDPAIKAELFHAADIYFQPGWVGLSVVEGMAYNKPVFTLEREADIFQCVEFAYVQDGYNGKIFDSLDKLVNEVKVISDQDIWTLGENSKKFVREFLTMENMVKQATSTLKKGKN